MKKLRRKAALLLQKQYGTRYMTALRAAQKVMDDHMDAVQTKRAKGMKPAVAIQETVNELGLLQ